MSPVDISIIIPLYRGKRYYRQLMNLINTNCVYKNLYTQCMVEVILVNDYPSEQIILLEEQLPFVVRLFAHEKNRGIHAARVTGVCNARGTYIVMFDQDDLVRENWLYSQWNEIQSRRAEVCVCNGWRERFQIITNNEDLEKRLCNPWNLKIGNPIMSPGQVILKRDCIPQEWLKYIQKVNGSDDFLLWLMMKKNCHFSINKEFLYYHTPERTRDSIDNLHMAESLEETLAILKQTNFLGKEELDDLKQYIEFCRGQVQESNLKKKKYLAMFHVVRRWLNLKNNGVNLANFFKEQSYNRIAIYGLGYIGRSFLCEVENSGLSVQYALDKKNSLIDFKQQLKVFQLEDDLPKVDMVVVTLVERYENIVKQLKEKLKCPIITIEELISELEYE